MPRWTYACVAAALAAAAALSVAPAATAAPSSSGQQSAIAHGKASHLSSRLAQLSTPAAQALPATARAQALGVPARGAGSLVQPTPDSVTVEIRAAREAGTAAAAATIASAGGRVLHVSERYATITASVPVTSLSSLGDDPALASVSEVITPLTSSDPAGAAAGSAPAATSTITTCGTATSEGVTQLKVGTARDSTGMDGTGVTVGVLSDSYDTDGTAATHAAGDVLSGDLPGPGNPCGRTSPVTVLAGQGGPADGSDEGRAMLQIVHDVAPGAHLDFATAFTSLTSFADNVRALATAGADVIVDDVTYFDEPFFQDGPVSTAISDVAAQGVHYYTSAGNSNQVIGGHDVASWEAPAYRGTACPALVTSGYTGSPLIDCLDFDPSAGTDNGRTFTLANGGSVMQILQWEQPWFGVTSDIDLALLDVTANKIVAVGGDYNPTTQEPFEYLSYTNATGASHTYATVVARCSGAALPRIKIVNMRASGLSAMEYPVSSGGDVVGPTIFGHSAAADATVTGAVPYNAGSLTTAQPEAFTSRGPATMYLGPVSGSTPASVIAPDSRAKPDVAATDGGATTFFAQLVSGVWRFYGTSAAAPHAAGLAALAVQKSPDLTPAAMRAQMMATATTMPAAPANSVGTGLIDAVALLNSVGPPTAVPVITTATPGIGSITLAFTLPAGGPAATGFTATCTPGVGSPVSVSGAASPLTITGLTLSTAYTCAVAATNTHGTGPSSTAVAVTTLAEPVPTAVPVITTATPGIGSATLAFTLPAGGPAATGFTATCTPGVGAAASISGAASPLTVTGLTPGTAYDCTVAATNTGGAGPSSIAASVTPLAPPAPTAVPVITSATPAIGSITLAFTLPAGGPAATGFSATCTPGAGTPVTVTGAASPLVVTGLTPGALYNCSVAATNAGGTGPSSSSASVTVTPDHAPTLSLTPLAAVQLGNPVVRWSTTDDVGLQAIRIRVRTASGGGRLGSWTSTPNLAGSARSTTLTGLPQGGFCVQVTAVDSRGQASPARTTCSTIPLDDRLLAGSTSTWARVPASTAYRRTVSVTGRTGAFLRRTGVYGSKLTLIAPRTPRAGTVGVYVNGVLKARIALASSTVLTKRQFPVTTGRMTGATVVVKVLTPGTGVQIDGLAVSP